MSREPDQQARKLAEAAARRSYGKLVAFLAARSRDVAQAEDALSEAFAAALADWPQNGCPANPDAWLLTVARRRLVDAARRRQTGDAAREHLQRMAEGLDAAEQEAIPDRRLALLFACAHPAIDPSVRAPLMLQVVLGLDAKTIGPAFLIAPATMGKRLVRAKDKIRQAAIPLRVPDQAELPERLDAVLSAIYAGFSEGWSDALGADTERSDLREEALYLAQLVSELLPDEPEALGLRALMLYADARRPARRDAQGEYVPLARQDRTRWDAPKIAHAEALLQRATRLGSIGRYQLEAALQSAHVHRCRDGHSNWAQVVRLYDALLALVESPVVAINRALALAELHGPQAGIDALKVLADDPRVESYQPYWAASAELLARANERVEARRAYELAIGLERDPAVRRFLQRRQAELR